MSPLAKPAISSANSVSDRPTRIASARAMRVLGWALLPPRSSMSSAEPRLVMMSNRNRMTTTRMVGLLGPALQFSRSQTHGKRCPEST